MAKKRAKQVHTAVLIAAICVTGFILLGGMYLVAIAKSDVAREMIRAMTMGTGGVAALGLLKILQSRYIQTAVENDADETAQANENIKDVKGQLNGGFDDRIRSIIVKVLSEHADLVKNSAEVAAVLKLKQEADAAALLKKTADEAHPVLPGLVNPTTTTTVTTTTVEAKPQS